MSAEREQLFEPAGPRSAKDRCVECGATGYPWGSWKDRHRAGHKPSTCCGKTLTVLRNGKARKHSRAPLECVEAMP